MDLVHSEAEQNKALTQSTIHLHNTRILMIVNGQWSKHSYKTLKTLFVSFSLPKNN